MTLNNSYFYKINFWISYELSICIQLNLCCIFRCYNSTRKNLDYIYFV